MLDLIKRIFAPTATRSLDAAASGRRWSARSSIANLNSDIFAGGMNIRRRAAYYARNNPHAAAGINSLVGNMVGTGIVPQPQHPDPAVRAMLSELWGRWTSVADVSGRTDFYGLQAQATRSMIEAGEALLRFRLLNGVLKVQQLHPDQLPLDHNRDNPDGSRIRGGVELDPDDQVVAYHLYRRRPNDAAFNAVGLPGELVRVPASEIIHLFLSYEAGQTRGLSWLAPILSKLSELDQFDDAQLLRQKISAMFAGFIVDPTGDAAGLGGTNTADTEGVLEASLEPGTLQRLDPGQDIRFSEPAELGEYAAFVKAQIRAVATGLGCTYEQLSGDYEGVTYSSVRASLVEFRRWIEQIQHSVVVHQMCRPVWERFVRMAALRGEIPAADFDRDPAAFLDALWLPPKFAWVDPKKDAEAEILQIEAGLKSRRMAVSELGYSIEQVDAEIAADRARETALGLSFSAPAPAPAQQDPAE